MEKLIELLNEFEKNRIEKINSEGKLWVKLSFRPYTEESLTNKGYRSCWLEICSKYYGFIGWLVDNDKIDIKALVVKGEMRSGWDFENKKGDEETGEESWNKYFSELCLMILAIQDEPINFLISILK